jgi:glutaryl-CoA dehydrogenase
MINADSLLSDKEIEGRDNVRSFLNREARPHIAAWSETCSAPIRDLARQFGELGLLGMHLDGYGCPGSSATAYGLACMELEAVDSSLRTLVSVQGSLAMFAIYEYGSEEQKKEWLPLLARGELIGCFGLTEPDAGSNPGAMSTTATQSGTDWILSGHKTWITSASIADVAIVWAKTEKGVNGFVVPTDAPGVSSYRIDGKLSMRAAVTGGFELEDVRLPASSILPKSRGLRSPLGCLDEARFGIAFGALGAARDCLDSALDYAIGRHQFGRPIAGFQLTQQKLADMALELQKGFLLALHIARLKDEGLVTPAMISLGKLNNVREALNIARTCRTILGANGISDQYPMMRHANNLESVLTYEGTNEIHTLIVGQRLTGVPAYE